MMLGKSLCSPLLAFDSGTCFCFSFPDIATAARIVNVNLSNGIPPQVFRGAWTSILPSKKWELNSTTQTENLFLSDEERKTWDASRQALSAFSFSAEEETKILGKAFGHIHSPYWSEERKKEVPTYELVTEVLDYLRSLSLSDDDLSKLLKKFPEVLGCSLEHELRTNVKVLETVWGIKEIDMGCLVFVVPYRKWVILGLLIHGEGVEKKIHRDKHVCWFCWWRIAFSLL